jgi:hypothetical protein
MVIARFCRALLSATCAAIFVIGTGHSSRADPATAGLMISAAQTGMSLFGPKSPDVTAAMIRAQSVAIQQIHIRLDALEGSVSSLLNMVAVLPEEVQKLLKQNSEADRASTVKGTIGTLQVNLSNLATLKEEGDKRAKEIEQFELLTRITLDNLRTERIALFDDSDFALPFIVMALDVEMLTLSALAPIRDEISSQLRAYDSRIGLMLDETRLESLVQMRAELEKKQRQEASAIAKVVSGSEDFAEGTWPWITHTLIGKKEGTCYRRPRPPKGSLSGRSDFGSDDPISYSCLKPYPVHSRSWQRQIATTALLNLSGSELFTIALKHIEPVSDEPGGKKNSTPHTNSDKDFEKKALDAERSLQIQVDVFNQRANAIAHIIELEQLATFARLLIARWDEVDAARRLQAADAAGRVKLAEILNGVEQKKRNEEARFRIEQMTEARKNAWIAIQAANDDLDATIKEAKNNAWMQDVMFLLDVFKFSFQVAEVTERLDIFETNPPETAQTKAVEEISKAKAKSRNNVAKSKVVDKVIALGLSDEDKGKAIIAILKNVKSADSWKTSLPDGATLPETQLAFAATLLDSMASAQLPSIHQSYNEALSGALSSKKELIGAILLPVPVSGSFSDDLSRKQFRKQINELARGYAKRRIEDKLKVKPY